jgi:hypothetical protein
MSTLNRYIHNRAYWEGSTLEAYTTEKAINCCTWYIRDGRVIDLPIPQHEGRTLGIDCTGRKLRTNVQYETVQEAHHNILNQLVVMEPYVDKHLEEIHTARDG